MILSWLALASCFLILVFASIGLLRIALTVVTIQGQSMSPVLEESDRVLVWRFWPTRWLRHGHIVIVRQWGDEGSPPFIKRIVGLPGDTLVTSIDDLPEHLRPSLLAAHDTQGRRVWHIPPGHLFVRGDNRRGSVDSLSWGPIPFQRVDGIVLRKLSDQDVLCEPGMFHISRREPHVGQPVPPAETCSSTHVSVRSGEKVGRR